MASDGGIKAVQQTGATAVQTNEIDSRRRSITILYCFLAALCEGIDLQAAGVAAAGIGIAFKPTPDQLGTFFSASTVGLFCGALIGGRLADSVGRKKVLVVSIGLFGAFSLLTSVATTMQSLIWLRGLTGLGLGGALPMVLALVTEVSSPDRRHANAIRVYAAMPLGGAAASLLSMLIQTSQWRTIFLVGGLCPLLLALLMSSRVSESSAFVSSQLKTDPRSVGSFSALFSEGRTWCTALLWASFLLELLILYLLLNWLPTLLMNDGLNKVQAAGSQIGFNLGGVLSALLMGYLLRGRLRHLTVGLVFVTLPVLMALLAGVPRQFGIISATVFLLGCAVLAAQAFLYGVAPIAYPARIRGIGVGAAVAAGRIGSVVGPKLGGALKAAGHGPSQLLMDLVPIVIVGSLCSLSLAWLMARRRLQPDA